MGSLHVPVRTPQAGCQSSSWSVGWVEVLAMYGELGFMDREAEELAAHNL